MSRVDVNQDGLIEYQEFVPMCFSLMVQRFADHVLHSTLLSTNDQLQNYVLHCFQDFDVESVLHRSFTLYKEACNCMCIASLIALRYELINYCITCYKGNLESY
jgi:hypothetical protein